MESELHASNLDTATRLTRARDSVNSSALKIKDSLGRIVTLTGASTHSNQPLWRRLDVFANTDLQGILSADAQSEIADRLRPLISLHTRLVDARWEVGSLPGSLDSESPAPEALIGRGGGLVTTTSIGSVELLSELFDTVAAAVESLSTRLAAQRMFDAPIPVSLPAYIREIEAVVARVSTDRDPVWTWRSLPDAQTDTTPSP